MRILFLLTNNKKKPYEVGRLDFDIKKALECLKYYKIDVIKQSVTSINTFGDDKDYTLDLSTIQTSNEQDPLIHLHDENTILIPDMNFLYAAKMIHEFKNLQIFFTKLETIVDAIKGNYTNEVAQFIGNNFQGLFLCNDNELLRDMYSNNNDYYLFYSFIQFELSFKRNIIVYPPLPILLHLRNKHIIQTKLKTYFDLNGKVTLPTVIFGLPTFVSSCTTWDDMLSTLAIALEHEVHYFEQRDKKRNRKISDNSNTPKLWYNKNFEFYKDTGVEINFLKEGKNNDNLLLVMHQNNINLTPVANGFTRRNYIPTELVSHTAVIQNFRNFMNHFHDDENPKPLVKCIARPNLENYEPEKLHIAISCNNKSVEQRFEREYVWGNNTSLEILDSGHQLLHTNNYKNDNDWNLLVEELFMDSGIPTNIRKYIYLAFEVDIIHPPQPSRKQKTSKKPAEKIPVITDVHIMPIHLTLQERHNNNEIIEKVTNNAITYYRNEFPTTIHPHNPLIPHVIPQTQTE